MKCQNPFQVKNPRIKWKYNYICVPCGSCMNCRINQMRIWEHRIRLELENTPYAAWCCFTYDDNHLPDPPFVYKSHVQQYIKRLRKEFSKNERKIRYFAVGEYGATKARPHYHIILFGVDGTDYFGEQKYANAAVLAGRVYRATSESDWAKIYNSWTFGSRNTIGSVEKGAIPYTLGYIRKKLTKEGDDFLPYTLDGRQFAPEFSLKSQSIGMETIRLIASDLKTDPHFKDAAPVRILARGLQRAPLGRYLTQRFAEFSGTINELLKDRSRYCIEFCQTYGLGLEQRDTILAVNNADAKQARVRARNKTKRRKI